MTQYVWTVQLASFLQFHVNKKQLALQGWVPLDPMATLICTRPLFQAGRCHVGDSVESGCILGCSLRFSLRLCLAFRSRFSRFPFVTSPFLRLSQEHFVGVLGRHDFHTPEIIHRKIFKTIVKIYMALDIMNNIPTWKMLVKKPRWFSQGTGNERSPSRRWCAGGSWGASRGN